MLVVDSVATLKQYSPSSGNTYMVIRHGEAEHNLTETWSCTPGVNDKLTAHGIEQVRESVKPLVGRVDRIIASPFVRGQESARVAAEVLGIDPSTIITDARVRC